MESFPLFTELVDLLFCYFDDNRDLETCRLVSQAFGRAASRILYRSVSVTLYDPPIYTNKRCEIMNEMLRNKPYILNYIRSLNVNLWRHPGPLQPWDEDVPGDYDLVVDQRSTDNRELTKFLLAMTHATGLEELVIKGRERLIHVGQHTMMALVGIRFMPSLRHLRLLGLQDPPTALVIGNPGADGLTRLSVHNCDFDLWQSEPDWTQGFEIPTQGPLSTSFKEASVDWDTVLRVHSHLSTFNIEETPLFRSLTHVYLSSILPFYEYMEEVRQKMGGRRPLFEKVNVLRYWTFARPIDRPWLLPDARFLEKMIGMFAAECRTIEKLVVELVIDATIPRKDGLPNKLLFPTAHFLYLREIHFSLEGRHPSAIDNPGWFIEVTHWLEAIPRHHSIEQITISCYFTVVYGDKPDKRIDEAHQWRKLEGKLDRLPALADVKLHLDAVVRACEGGGEVARIASEERANFLRMVWSHPRCSVSVTGP